MNIDDTQNNKFVNFNMKFTNERQMSRC